MELTELSYALDTFYLLMSGALVMWMAAGFAMLEAGMVRSKNTTEILAKNILLYAVACLSFLVIGMLKLYMFGEMQTARILRELKRVELMLAVREK